MLNDNPSATYQRPGDYWCNDDEQVKIIETALDLYEQSLRSENALTACSGVDCERCEAFERRAIAALELLRRWRDEARGRDLYDKTTELLNVAPQASSECRRLTYRLEKIDAVLDQLGAPKSDDWDGIHAELSQVGRILRLTGFRRDEDGSLVRFAPSATNAAQQEGQSLDASRDVVARGQAEPASAAPSETPRVDAAVLDLLRRAWNELIVDPEDTPENQDIAGQVLRDIGQFIGVIPRPSPTNAAPQATVAGTEDDSVAVSAPAAAAPSAPSAARLTVDDVCKSRCETCREGDPYTEKSKAEGTYLFHAVGEYQLPCYAKDIRALGDALSATPAEEVATADDLIERIAGETKVQHCTPAWCLTDVQIRALKGKFALSSAPLTGETPRTQAVLDEIKRTHPGEAMHGPSAFGYLEEHARQFERELRKLAAEYADLKVYGRKAVPSATERKMLEKAKDVFCFIANHGGDTYGTPENMCAEDYGVLADCAKAAGEQCNTIHNYLNPPDRSNDK